MLCTIQCHNHRVPTGRGFAIVKLLEVKIDTNFTHTIIIAVDPRQNNRAAQSFCCDILLFFCCVFCSRFVLSLFCFCCVVALDHLTDIHQISSRLPSRPSVSTHTHTHTHTLSLSLTCPARTYTFPLFHCPSHPRVTDHLSACTTKFPLTHLCTKCDHAFTLPPACVRPHVSTFPTTPLSLPPSHLI